MNQDEIKTKREEYQQNFNQLIQQRQRLEQMLGQTIDNISRMDERIKMLNEMEKEYLVGENDDTG